jgi:hypothetical protein
LIALNQRRAYAGNVEIEIIDIGSRIGANVLRKGRLKIHRAIPTERMLMTTLGFMHELPNTILFPLYIKKITSTTAPTSIRSPAGVIAVLDACSDGSSRHPAPKVAVLAGTIFVVFRGVWMAEGITMLIFCQCTVSTGSLFVVFSAVL